MNKIEYKNIYVDMDNTIAKFSEGVLEMSGYTIDQLKEMGEWDSKKREMYSNKIFETLKPTKLVKLLKNNIGKFKILSSVGYYESEMVIQQKIKWLNEIFGENIEYIFVSKSHHKAEYAENSILIDDREVALEPFIENGGYGIKYDDSDEVIEVIKNLF